MVEKGLNGIGVEVGVETGMFSDILLKNSKLKTLISVDKWRSSKKDKIEEMYKSLRLLEKYGNRSVCIRGTSVEVAKFFRDEFLDFAYIDANHAEKFIRNDLRCWWPKLKPGGLFAGHDYFDFVWNGTPQGVIQAVDDFVKEHNVKLHLTDEEPTHNSWYCFKPLKTISLL